MDLFYLAVTILFFALSLAGVAAVKQLMESP
jgi:hypothetical protein